MFKILITSKAKKEFKKISAHHKHALAMSIEELKDDPFAGKPLKRELTGKWSLRVGVYRIIYAVNKSTQIITILTAGHRGEIYK